MKTFLHLHLDKNSLFTIQYCTHQAMIHTALNDSANMLVLETNWIFGFGYSSHLFPFPLWCQSFNTKMRRKRAACLTGLSCNRWMFQHCSWIWSSEKSCLSLLKALLSMQIVKTQRQWMSSHVYAYVDGVLLCVDKRIQSTLKIGFCFLPRSLFFRH